MNQQLVMLNPSDLLMQERIELDPDPEDLTTQSEGN
jgi:hypothetical protein